MLGFRRHRWRTVVGGSREYVRSDRSSRSARACSLRRGGDRPQAARDGVELRTARGEVRRFDKAVVATHPDEALRLLADPSDDERRILGAFPYTRNETVLHTDERLLPSAPQRTRRWNFQSRRLPAPARRRRR